MATSISQIRAFNGYAHFVKALEYLKKEGGTDKNPLTPSEFHVLTEVVWPSRLLYELEHMTTTRENNQPIRKEVLYAALFIRMEDGK